MRLEKLLFKCQCHLLTTERLKSVLSRANTTPDPPFLPVKVFVIIPINIPLSLGDISNVIVFMLMPVFNDPVQWIILCDLT